MGRRVLVTGGARGIGRAIAEAFGAAGDDVAIGDLAGRGAAWSYPLSGTADLAAAVAATEAAGAGRVLALPLDVTDAASCAAALATVQADLGGLDVLVNNAGIVQAGELDALTEAQWERTFAVNAKGPFLVTQAALPLLERGASIVNISSIAGRQGYPGMSAYCASKFAVLGFTQALAAELAPRGIRVNAVCPGILGTAMWLEHLLPARGGIDADDRETSFRATVEERIPLGRPQDPGDVAEAVLYLAGAHNVTGTTVTVAGGLVLG
jgi:meso-butanediol dehydrogenase/(S,S)-butanediol dehydrogenase/diacetyl reductase